MTLLMPGPTRTSSAADIVRVTPNLPMMPPELPTLQPEQLGDMVVKAVRDGTFFLPSHPEVHSIVAERGSDPEAFLKAATQRFIERQSRSEGVVIG